MKKKLIQFSFLIAGHCLFAYPVQALYAEQLETLKEFAPNQNTIIAPGMLPQNYRHTGFGMTIVPNDYGLLDHYSMTYEQAVSIPVFKTIKGPYAQLNRLYQNFNLGRILVYVDMKNTPSFSRRSCSRPDQENWQIPIYRMGLTLSFCADPFIKTVNFFQDGKQKIYAYKSYNVHQQNFTYFEIRGEAVLKHHFEQFISNLQQGY